MLLTTANFPDVMLPIYKSYRAASFFFIIFLVLGFFILMNLILAAFIRAYENQMRTAERLARARRDCAFEAAFMLLDLNCNGFVDLMEFSALLQVPTACLLPSCFLPSYRPTWYLLLT